MKLDEEQEQFRQICREHGCKCTPQRWMVYRVMYNNLTHPNVNQIWEKVRTEIPSITRESVFRILNEFAEFGIIGRMDKIEDARFDGRISNHGHLICEKCGAIIDFDLPASLSGFNPSAGFQARHMELRMSGICAKCAKNNKEKGEQK